MLNKIDLSDLQSSLKQSYSLFIGSSSFEDRCLSIPNNIDVRQLRRALVLSNNDLIQYVGANTDKVLQYFGERGNLVEISTRNPLLTADSIDKSITQAIQEGLGDSILLDISTFTHESLLILLRLLRMRCPKARITCVYANASEYSSGDDVKHKWLSRGIREVRSVLGFPGNIVPSRKTHLILIVGYEYERAVGLIETVEPNNIALGYGRSGSATTDKNKEANEYYLHLVHQMATSFSDIDQFEIPCNDPYQTRDLLLSQVDKVRDMNIIIAPMNNKLSTIGTALAAFDNNDIQICYAQALSYNYSGYSVPGSKCYVFDLKL